ncbi:MAG: ABC transporter substrate-binding protein [Rhodospirillaceae bacterium]|nr:ABC transporter substrate-binding protein [Rhodospirillaceae bacterium]
MNFLRIVQIGLAGVWGAAALVSAPVLAAEPVRIGEINSYSAIPSFTIPYRNGWKLAVDEINRAGGVLGGRPLEVISRDDGGKPADAVTAANELVRREKVDILAGGYLSNVGLALTDFARQRKILFVASEPLTDAMVWSQGNRYTFRLRPSAYMQTAMLVEEAAKLPAKRWATVAPNYEYGHAFVDNFKTQLKAKRPDVEFVAEQWPAQGRLDAGPTVQALAEAKPDAIFNATFSTDLAKFVREGRARGLFENRSVVSALTGEPEYLDTLGEEAPEGWIVTGYPWDAIALAEHKAFVDAYRAAYGEPPRMGSLVGYNTMKAIAAGLNAAGSTDTEALIRAFRGLSFDTPVGRLSFRAADHQSTMGAWVGRTTVVDGHGRMVDWVYRDGAAFLPPPEAIPALRPAKD